MVAYTKPQQRKKEEREQQKCFSFRGVQPRNFPPVEIKQASSSLYVFEEKNEIKPLFFL